MILGCGGTIRAGEALGLAGAAKSAGLASVWALLAFFVIYQVKSVSATSAHGGTRTC